MPRGLGWSTIFAAGLTMRGMMAPMLPDGPVNADWLAPQRNSAFKGKPLQKMKVLAVSRIAKEANLSDCK